MKIHEFILTETFVNLLPGQEDQKAKYAEQIFAMLQTAYAPIGGIKGDSFIDVGVSIPDAVTGEGVDRSLIASSARVVGEGVGGVEHRDAIDEVADRSGASRCFGAGDDGRAWETVEDGAIPGLVREDVGLRLI